MSATATKVDIGALTAAIRGEAVQRVAVAIGTSVKALDERDNPLNENQVCELIEGAIYAFDGFGRACAKEIVTTFGHDDVEVELWGLDHDMEDLLDG